MKRTWLKSNHLLSAIEAGDVETAEQLIDGGYDVDTILLDGKTAISICIERGKTELVKLLLRKNCSLSLVTPNCNYPLHLAVHGGDINLVQMLLKNRVDTTVVNLLRKTALHLACENGFSDIAKVLIDRSSYSTVDASDIDGATPLMFACLNGMKDTVEYLLRRGCSVNAVDMQGETPLFYVLIEKNMSGLLKCLLDAGADVNQKNYKGVYPLLRTLEQAYYYGVRSNSNAYILLKLLFLIDHGCNVNIENQLGQTPLHYAACAGDDIVVKKLLNSGCKVEVVDNLRMRPLYYACRDARKTTIDLLIKGGANIRNTLDKIKVTNAICQREERSDNISTIVHYLIEKTKEIQSLKALCRFAIRKCFTKSIEKNAKFLPLPESLKNYIIQFDR